jgi:hypothetical protein
MMRLTIVPEDGTVVKDGFPYTALDLSPCGIPDDVHALQWADASGWIEYKDHYKPNEDITSLPEWANACAAVWDAKDYEEKHPPEPVPTPEEIIAANKSKAEGLLAESDWSVLPDVPLQNKDEWIAYRAVLRDIATNPTLDPVWPVKPETVWA